MEDKPSRRGYLKGLSTAAAVGLAGCSTTNTGQETETSGTDNDKSDGDTTTETDQPTETQSGTDNQLTGEPQVEEYLSSEDGVPRKQAAKDVVYWVEFENPNQQMNRPKWTVGNQSTPNAPSAMYWARQGKTGVKTNVKQVDFDSIYFGVHEDEEHMTMIFLDPDTYNPDLSVDKNWVENDGGLYISSEAELNEYTPKQAFSEVVKDYSDVSEDFPREYFEAIEG